MSLERGDLGRILEHLELFVKGILSSGELMVEILTILGVVAWAMPLMSHLHMISVWVCGRSLIAEVMMAAIIQLI